jgi:ABC-type sugar transport system ATPase subunit
LVFRLRGREDWTLTRRRIPARPAVIAPLRNGGERLDPSKAILHVTGLHKRFGSLVVATDINLEVYPYKLHSFIGPNGAGKTTFFNMMTGILQPNAGKIVFDGHDITNMPVHKRIRLGLSRSFQILSVFRELTAFENVRVAVQASDKRSTGLWRDAYDYEDLNARTWSLLAAVGLQSRVSPELLYMKELIEAGYVGKIIACNVATMRDGPANGAPFEAGVRRSGDPGGLLHHIFGVRAQTLVGALAETDAGAYLSGILIGHEIRAAMPGGAVVHVIGAPELTKLYASAIATCGGYAERQDGDAAAAGLALIGDLATWV